MPAEVFIVDTFTSQKFRGNPTAVCILQQSLPETIFLPVAKELNFPVTAFIEKHKTLHRHYTIRYFTTIEEIPACGHATLASAKVVFETFPSSNKIQFETIERIIIEAEKHDRLISMEYPKYELSPFDVSEEMLHSLQLSHFKNAGSCSELETLFIELDSAAILKSIQPDFTKLVASSNRLKEVVVTSISDDDNYDYLLRSFCPWIGINEDPVTGSAHTVLSGYWSKRLKKNNLKAYQASLRGGEIFVATHNDKTMLSGEALIIMSGILAV